MNKSNVKKLENKYNISIHITNKYSGFYSYEFEIFNYNKDTAPGKLMINSKEPIYKQIENFLNK